MIIRGAKPEDAHVIARAVSMALGGDESHPLFKVFEELAKREVAQYSYRNTFVAEQNGVVMGAVVGYDGALLQVLREPIFPLIMEYLGEEMEIEDETGAGEFYVDSIAVFPEFRGLGVGRTLLQYMVENARSLGFSWVGLLVDAENPRAESLYHSLGFERVNPAVFLGHPMWHLQRCLE